jgi:hypothetical protein
MGSSLGKMMSTLAEPPRIVWTTNTSKGRKSFGSFEEAESYVNQHGGEVVGWDYK